MTQRGGRRWLIAGGIVGLAASPTIVRAVREARARSSRAERHGSDPVEAFREAPCYERSDWGASAK